MGVDLPPIVGEGLDASGRGGHKNATRKLLPWNLSFTKMLISRTTYQTKFN